MAEKWYKEGLRFKCTGCGECCTGAPGFVWVNDEEVESLARALNISSDSFIRKYTRRIGFRLSLKENPRNFDCVFLKDKQCLVYHARPKQCRSFPWWRGNLHTKEDWKQTASRCEGIDHKEAPLIPFEEIEKELDE